MREIRTSGSEGGEAQAFPTPIEERGGHEDIIPVVPGYDQEPTPIPSRIAR
jgi:hypothetical protein